MRLVAALVKGPGSECERPSGFDLTGNEIELYDLSPLTFLNRREPGKV